MVLCVTHEDFVGHWPVANPWPNAKTFSRYKISSGTVFVFCVWSWSNACWILQNCNSVCQWLVDKLQTFDLNDDFFNVFFFFWSRRAKKNTYQIIVTRYLYSNKNSMQYLHERCYQFTPLGIYCCNIWSVWFALNAVFFFLPIQFVFSETRLPLMS